jgi:hypothetical protein
MIRSKISLTLLAKPHRKARFERAWWIFFAFQAAAAG